MDTFALALDEYECDLAEWLASTWLRDDYTIGEIKSLWRTCPVWPALPKQYTRDIRCRIAWQYLDTRYGVRPDYRLWRLVPFADEKSEEWQKWPRSPLDHWELISAGIEDHADPVVTWGMLCVFSRLITSRRSREVLVAKDPADAKLINERCDCVMSQASLVLRKLEPLIGMTPECEIIRVAALDAVQHSEYGNTKHPRSLQDLHNYIKLLIDTLSKVDPTWVPGKSLSLLSIRKDWNEYRRVAPYEITQLARGAFTRSIVAAHAESIGAAAPDWAA